MMELGEKNAQSVQNMFNEIFNNLLKTLGSSRGDSKDESLDQLIAKMKEVELWEERLKNELEIFKSTH